MNYDEPRLRQLLAAEYALGTLRGAARRRFQHLLGGDLQLRRELRWWEQHIALLSTATLPVEPPPQAWERLARRAGIEAAATKPPRRRRERLWRNWAILASAGSVLLAAALMLVLYVRPPPVVYVSYLQVPDSSMHWTVRLVPHKRRVIAVAGGAPTPAQGWVAELWWIDQDGKPVAVCLLPKSGQIDDTFPNGLRLSPHGTLAVSIEAPGGSPGTGPTGPVILAIPVAHAV